MIGAPSSHSTMHRTLTKQIFPLSGRNEKEWELVEQWYNCICCVCLLDSEVITDMILLSGVTKLKSNEVKFVSFAHVV